MVDVGKRESAANRKRRDEYEELMGHFSDPGLPVGTSLILAALGSCALLDAGSKQKKRLVTNAWRAPAKMTASENREGLGAR